MIVNMLFPAFLGFLILAPFLGLVFNFLKGAGHPASGLHTAGVFLFVYYLFGLWWMTGIGPLQPFAPRLVLVPFADMIQGPVDTALNVVLFVPLGFFLPWLWRTFDGLKQTFAPRLVLVPFADMIQGPVDTALNVVLFVPLGFFLPWLWRTFDGLKQTALMGFLLSLGIELLQVFGLGITDINDLITNTLGTILGYGLFCLAHHLMKPSLWASNCCRFLDWALRISTI